MKRPKIIKLGRSDHHLNSTYTIIGKTAMGIKNHFAPSTTQKTGGFYRGTIYVSGRWLFFAAVKLSYIPEKFLK